jgi:nucleotidyltransferase substrate binding protein (TIGR01987 family)
MSNQDVRWVQRLAHFGQALEQLREANTLAETRPLSKLEQQGMIKAFEFTYELAWNTLKEFLENQGVQDLFGPRAVIRASFKVGLLR